ncbi:hypothetical protein [Xenorhabdus bovienii]|uniref:hypothetical protein n=1 Tax=Xenorhabdus bovienii TaxID=40576 RepID=UPI0023B2B44D|nr:hypothetical protein [Xenorhabdus bovienii]
MALKPPRTIIPQAGKARGVRPTRGASSGGISGQRRLPRPTGRAGLKRPSMNTGPWRPDTGSVSCPIMWSSRASASPMAG